jgi:hypothetical protein
LGALEAELHNSLKLFIHRSGSWAGKALTTGDRKRWGSCGVLTGGLIRTAAAGWLNVSCNMLRLPEQLFCPVTGQDGHKDPGRYRGAESRRQLCRRTHQFTLQEEQWAGGYLFWKMKSGILNAKDTPLLQFLNHYRIHMKSQNSSLKA